MKLMQLLFESTLTLKSVTYEQLPDGRIELPESFDVSALIYDKDAFERWKEKFISRFGSRGSLVMIRPRVFKVVNNANWDKHNELASKR